VFNLHGGKDVSLEEGFTTLLVQLLLQKEGKESELFGLRIK